MTLQLRPYQSAAIQSIYDYYSDGGNGNVLLTIPTGCGKSLVMAKFVEGVLKVDPQHRILIVTHVRELIEQNFSELKRLWPEAPAGIYSAGLKRREIDAPILFAGIQSIHARAEDVGLCHLVLIDEAHLIPRSSNTMYRRFLEDVLRINPLMKVIGLTATPYRLDSGLLHEGKDAIFTDVAYEVGVRDMIEKGYLSPLVSKRSSTQIDVTGVGTRGGEFIPKLLAEAADREEVTRAAVEEILECGQARRSWLIFCTGVKHALHVRDAIREHGVICETITGDTPSDERDQLIRDFKQGRIRCLTNANVLTTGFNAPGVDLIAMLRPTKSVGLYVQIVGRGCRLAPGKENCLVLDFGGNIERHGPIDDLRHKVSKKGEGDGEAPSKQCPNCDAWVHAALLTCPECGHRFPPPQSSLEGHASELDVITNRDPFWVDVDAVTYQRHDKPGKPPSMRVSYQCGLLHHNEWVCFEHAGYARQKAASWWAKHAYGHAHAMPIPQGVDEAVARSGVLRPPRQIAVRNEGRYFKVLGERF